MKKKLIFISMLVAAICLCAVFSRYLYFLNEPFVMDKIDKSNMKRIGTCFENEWQNKDNIYYVTIENTLLNRFFSLIMSGDNIYSEKYENNYIAAVNEDKNCTDYMFSWDEKKYGIPDKAAMTSNGTIYVLGLVKSMDMSKILEENIWEFRAGDTTPRAVLCVKHDDVVSDLNKSIYALGTFDESVRWLESSEDEFVVKECSNGFTSSVASIKKETERLKNVSQAVILRDCFYIITKNNVFARVGFDGNIHDVRDFNDYSITLYRLFQFDGGKLLLHLLSDFDDRLMTYDGHEFENIDLNGLSAEGYISKMYQNNYEQILRKNSAVKYVMYAVFAAIIALIVVAIRYFYVNIAHRRMYITVKLILIIAPILIVGTYFIASFSASAGYKNIEQELFYGKLYSFNSYVDAKFAKIKEVYGYEEYLGDLFSEIELYGKSNDAVMAEISNIMDASFIDQQYDTEGWYKTADVIIDGCMYKILDTDTNDPLFVSRYATGRSYIASQVQNGKKYTSLDFGDEYIFGLYPVKNSQGQISGMIQYGTYYYGYINKIHDAMFSESMKRIVAMAVVLLTVMIFITVKSLFPITRLTKKIEASRDGELKEINAVKSNDEVSILTDSFNALVRSINENIRNMELLNSAYYRFVPLEFINLLEKKDIKEVSLGDSVNKVMTILCIGISNFYETMQNVEAERIFGLLSEVLEFTGPIIRKYGGVVDRYTDRGLIAMFPQYSKSAVLAAIEIINKQDADGTARISCSINRGPVTFGIIGEEQRLQNGAISRTTNYAQAIQENSAKLSSNILMTKSVYENLADTENLHVRYLGCIKLTAVKEPVVLYDVYEADNPNFIKIKNITKETFEESVKNFEEGNYREARQGFVDILDVSIDEAIVRNYFYQCDQYLKDKSNAGKELLL